MDPPMTAATLPELGPSLGRLVLPPASPAAEPLAPIRLTLVTGLFDAAGEARTALAAGSLAEARAGLAPAVWSGLWDRAVEQATAAVVNALESRLSAAAAESRMPMRMRDRLRITGAERRAIHARLGGGGTTMLREAELLPAADDAAWVERVAATARRVESAWLALEAAAAHELADWEPEIAAARSWRRPTWPLWAVTMACAALATWAGLLLGGYLPVPGPLRPLVEFWWSR
jgi:hypothetical protein